MSLLSPPDVERLEACYADHFRPLARVALLLVGSRELAEDLVQEAFVRLAGRAVWPQPGAELAYLRRTVVNLSHSHFRRVGVASRKQRRERVDAGDLTSPSGMARAGQSRLAAVVRALPMRQRVCVILFYYSDLSEREVAATLDTTVASVKSTLHRARATLARQLEDLR